MKSGGGRCYSIRIMEATAAKGSLLVLEQRPSVASVRPAGHKQKRMRTGNKFSI